MRAGTTEGAVLCLVLLASGTAHAHPGHAHTDVSAYANLQEAVDALPDSGGVLFIPRGTYSAATRPAFTGLMLPPRVQIVGEGRGVTVLTARGQSPDLVLIRVTGERCAVKEMTLEHYGGAGEGMGIAVGKEGESFEGLVVESVDILAAPSWAIDVWGDDRHAPGTFSIHNTFRRVRCAFTPAERGEEKGSIRIGRSCTTQWILECNLKGAGICVQTAGVGTVIMNTTIEPDGSEVSPFVIIEDGARSTHLVNCWFENWSDEGEQVFIECQGRTLGLDVHNSHFVKHAGTHPRLLRTSGATAARGVVFINPYYLGVRSPDGDDDFDLRHPDDEVEIIGGVRSNHAGDRTGALTVRRSGR